MLNRFTGDYLEALGAGDFAPRPKVAGRLASYDGLLMEAVGLSLPVGTICSIGEGAQKVEAEVIGFRAGRTLMMNLGGPAALPADVKATLQTQAAAAIHSPAISQKLIEFGVEPVGSSSADYAALLKSENARWHQLIKDLKITLD